MFPALHFKLVFDAVCVISKMYSEGENQQAHAVEDITIWQGS